MDKVRLGRALGYGTRHAAKTLAAVAEAAAAPDPRPAVDPPRSPAAAASDTMRMASPAASPRTRSGLPSPAQVRGAGRSLWGPLATYSGALWLRVTGLFFAIVALVLGNGAWRLRGVAANPAVNPVEARHFWLFAAFAVLFSYFAVSSFLRASLRERRAANR